MLLRRAAIAYDDEAARLAQDGLSPQAASLRDESARLRERAAAEDMSAARLEADQVHAGDPQRYVELRTGIQFIALPVHARDLANEILQAAARLGPQGTEALWRELVRRAKAKQVRFPTDLEPRFRAAVAAAARERAAPPPPPAPQHLRSAGELVLDADRLGDEARALSREDLYDRIVILAGQLKQLQETDVRPLGEQERALVRQGFGILTRISKTHQPGWTQTLDSKVTGEDWASIVRTARQRLDEREEQRRRLRERARREQVADALHELHETERRIVFQEGLERLRLRLYELGAADRAADEQPWLRRDARTQAAIACSAANGDEDRIERVAQVLAGHADLVAEGRAFRTLRRYWGMDEPAEPDTPDASAPLAVGEDLDEDEIAFTVGDLDEQEWPERILQARGAGQGERVLLVGGIPNLERRRLLRDFFGWQDVEWEESYRDHSADFRALRNRIRAGSFDRVIVLSRFCGHDVTQGLREVTRRGEVHYHVHPRGISIPALATFVYGTADTPA